MRTPIKLNQAERGWVSQQRARPCKHGHLRYDARIYRIRAAHCGSIAHNASVTGQTPIAVEWPASARKHVRETQTRR